MTYPKVLTAEGGAIRRGRILFRGAAIHGRSTAELVRQGIVHVLEGRRLFRQLDVEENLLMGAYARRDRRAEGHRQPGSPNDASERAMLRLAAASKLRRNGSV